MILALETSDIQCSVALWEDSQTLIEYNVELPRQHATLIGQLVEDGINFVHKQHTIESQYPELIAIAIGPGSFTGLRIGLSFAQGYCFGKNIPIIGISNHQVLAAQCLEQTEPVFTMIEARRSEVYLARHQYSESGLPQISHHNIVNKNDIANKIESGCQLIVTQNFEIEQNIINHLIHEMNVRYLKVKYSAAQLARLGQLQNKLLGPDDLAKIEPMYIRRFAGVS